MPTPEAIALSQEWQTLQNSYEQYEKSALLIKLIAVVLCAIGWAVAVDDALILIVVAILWLQDGIFKTFQARLGQRILRIEQLLAQGGTAGAAFQFHSEWLAARPGTVALIKEYLASAFRPSVAYPYVLLLAIDLVLFVAFSK